MSGVAEKFSLVAVTLNGIIFKLSENAFPYE